MDGFVDDAIRAVFRARGLAAPQLPPIGPDTPFGHAIKPHFALRGDNKGVNYGSFGMAPLSVTAAMWFHQFETVDGDSDRFYRRRVEPALQNVRVELARFLGLIPEEGFETTELEEHTADQLFLCDNVSDAVNIVAKSFFFSPQAHAALDAAGALGGLPRGGGPKAVRILVLDTYYPMCRNTLQFWLDRQAAAGGSIGGYAVEVVTLAVTEAMVRDPSGALTDAVVTAVTDAARPCHFLFIDHVFFAPALVIPLSTICKRIKAVRPHTLCVADAAHAIGNIPLNFASREWLMPRPPRAAGVPPQIGEDDDPCEDGAAEEAAVDVWFSNCHKWLMCPHTACVVFCKHRLQRFVHRAVVGNFYRGDEAAPSVAAAAGAPPPSSSSFPTVLGAGRRAVPPPPGRAVAQLRQHEYFWCGTRDQTPFLAIPHALAFRRSLGEERIVAANAALAKAAALRVAEIWGTEVFAAPEPGVVVSMSNVGMPGPCATDAALTARVGIRLLEHHDTFVAHLGFGGRCYARLSCQVYNQLSDFEYMATTFLVVMKQLVEEDAAAAATA